MTLRALGTSYGDRVTPATTPSLPTSLSASPVSFKDIQNRYANLASSERQYYDDNYIPIEKQVINFLGDNSIVDRARAESTASVARGGASDREIARYGGEVPPAVRQALARRKALSDQLFIDGAVNGARATQADTKTSLLNSLINIGTDVKSSAMQGMGQAAAGDANRTNAYNEAKAGYKASLFGLGGQLAGSAAMLGFAGML